MTVGEIMLAAHAALKKWSSTEDHEKIMAAATMGCMLVAAGPALYETIYQKEMSKDNAYIACI